MEGWPVHFAQKKVAAPQNFKSRLFFDSFKKRGVKPFWGSNFYDGLYSITFDVNLGLYKVRSDVYPTN
jgi:hypothetical protein